tara:strand:+ start:638 stop:1420 length:783 start_codon:yes stop_codon:yes gene_type:complete
MVTKRKERKGMKRLVHGTPITPKRFLHELKGHSFCVSYMHKEQIEDCINLVGENEILILDNGAFTAWKKGITLDDNHWNGFYAWANDVMDRCPNAVCVIPDVINGSEEENMMLISEAIKGNKIKYPERAMAIWHLNESLEMLEKLYRIFNFIGFGSCAEYDIARNGEDSAYMARIKEVWANMAWWSIKHDIDRPWIHMMRGLGVLHKIAFDSADSCNIAMNHCYKRNKTIHHVKLFADRLTAKVNKLVLPDLPLFNLATA